MRRIIILEYIADEKASKRVRYVLWAKVDMERKAWYANPTYESKVKDGSISAEELNLLRSGLLVEAADEQIFGGNISSDEIQASLVKALEIFQQQVNKLDLWNKYGIYYDDSSNTWSDELGAT